MKKNLKKALSLALCLVMTFSLLLPVAYAADTQDIPIITVPGTSNTSVYNADGEKIYPVSTEIEDIIKDKEKMEPVLQALAISKISGNWDYYSDALYNLMAPIYADVLMDENGNPAPGDHTSWSWSKNSIRKAHSNYGIYDYTYRYDERMSPMDIVEDFREYVNAVSEVTGSKKVGLIGRGYGSIIVSTYLAKYGDEGKVDTTLMYVPMVMGVDAVDAAFTGELFTEPDNLENFAKYYLNNNVIVDNDVTEMLIGLVTVLNYTKVLGFASDTLNDILANIKDNLMPRLLRDSYARNYSDLSMVSAEKYPAAREFIFGGYEEEFKGFLEKADRYHEEVQLPLLEKFDELTAEPNNMKFAVIAKYGTPAYPVYSGSDSQSDNSTSVYNMTFGATTSPINDVLSDEYIENAIANGTYKYISADKKIDASTAKYPDSTWFVKNVGHSDLPECINNIIYYIFRSVKQPTVWDDERYPQFTNYNSETGTLELITGPDESDKVFEKSNPITSLIKVLKWILNFLISKLRPQEA